MLSDSGRPLELGKIKLEPSAHSRASARTCNARSLSGTRCSRYIFILSAGTVHVAVSRSTSSHWAFLASAERDAVRIRYSRVAPVAQRARDDRTVAMASATSACGKARWCIFATLCFGSAAPRASPAGAPVPRPTS